MTEQEWLASEDPRAMLGLVFSTSDEGRVIAIPRKASFKVSDRKLRMFALACAQQAGHVNSEPGGTWEEWAGREERRPSEFSVADAARYMAGMRVGQNHELRLDVDQKRMAAALLRDIVGNPFRPAVIPAGPLVRCQAGCDHDGEHHEKNYHGGWDSWKCQACAGKGAVPGPCPWLTWNDAAVPRLAQAIYDERDFSPERMGILADVCEEAGCTDEAILRHLRGEPEEVLVTCAECGGGGFSKAGSGYGDVCDNCGGRGNDLIQIPPGPHCRGCWAIDLLIGRE